VQKKANAMKHALILDIETLPLPESEIEQFMPEFEAPGNLKDPIKIEAAIAEKRAAWVERAALSAVTGRVAMIGFWWTENPEPEVYSLKAPDDGSEARMLLDWWDRVHSALTSGLPLIGFNCHRFDMPFLIRRSLALRVPVPRGILPGASGYLPNTIIDLMKVWQMGDREATINLDRLARFLGAGQKVGDYKTATDALFTDRPAAEEYCRNDVRITAECARALGVIEQPY
jgi:hypothetical protein